MNRFILDWKGAETLRTIRPKEQHLHAFSQLGEAAYLICRGNRSCPICDLREKKRKRAIVRFFTFIQAVHAAFKEMIR